MKVNMKLGNVDALEAATNDFLKKSRDLEDSASSLLRAVRDLNLEISQPTDGAVD